MQTTDAIHLTSLDAMRLNRRLQRVPPSPADESAISELERLVDEAVVVPPAHIAADVVTMNSRAVLQPAGGGTARALTLVYPEEADPERGRISVASPMGRALLGRRVGEPVAIDVPGGARREWRLLRLEYQPEAAGHFDV